MTKKKLVYPYVGYSSSGSDADYEQPRDNENNIDINQYIEYDEGKNMRIYFKRTQFIQDAEEYLRNDNPDYEIVGIND